jgi:MmoB/DmpM family
MRSTPWSAVSLTGPCSPARGTCGSSTCPPAVLRVTRSSLSEALGRPTDLPSLEPAIASFAGRMRYDGDDTLTWYLTREDS